MCVKGGGWLEGGKVALLIRDRRKKWPSLCQLNDER